MTGPDPAELAAGDQRLAELLGQVLRVAIHHNAVSNSTLEAVVKMTYDLQRRQLSADIALQIIASLALTIVTKHPDKITAPPLKPKPQAVRGLRDKLLGDLTPDRFAASTATQATIYSRALNGIAAVAGGGEGPAVLLAGIANIMAAVEQIEDEAAG